ncbi:F0F1 ATP synthase subunit alpha [Rhodobacteraceae bacterium WD3A24]|nr:F0F1 ATP synthase subunit alpha [Rhodobacteraceae bacterium WD3A24]
MSARGPLETAAEAVRAEIEQALAARAPELHRAEIAHIVSLGNGVARIRGFTDLGADELVVFSGGLTGIAASPGMRGSGIVVLGDSGAVRVGDPVRRTGRVVDVPVGAALLGRVVDATGAPLDEAGPIDADSRLPIERPAPPIMDRAAVDVPLQTGIKAIDAAIPIGRGQRELILGDRQTGKTAIAVDAILNQADTGVISIYCAIGQRASAVARVIATLREAGAMDRSIVLAASGEDAPGLQFIAPYAATTMAEYFMARGRDVLVVYDDLTRHARAYRELSLLLRRPPGREAYPGDIFYIHSRLLERATHLRDDLGGGSMTALPVVETQAQNISAYIPTNLISITDGQIYLSPTLFRRGQLPAIDIGQSVSRVGGKVQRPAYRAVAGDLRLFYTQFEELESFARFGTQLDRQTRERLERGRRVREVLKQAEHDHLSVAEQIAILLAATEGLLDPVPVDRIAAAQARILAALDREPALRARIEEGAPLTGDDRAALMSLLTEAAEEPGETEETGDEHAEGEGDGDA